jgi:F0F1-type ATP synthase epsilon subunit
MKLELEIRVSDGVVLSSPVTGLRAADASGWFGLLPGHEPFLTLLSPCLLTYRDEEARVRAEAERVRQDALALHQRLEEGRSEQEQQRQDLLQKGRTQAEADRRRILAEGEETARRRQDELWQALRRDREEALQKVRIEVVRQALELSGQLMREASGRDLQQQLARRLVETLEAIPPEECARLGHEWAPADGAVLETAGDLEDASIRPIRSAVERLVGREVGLTPKTRPELVAGVRLRLGGHVWDASLAGELEHVGVPPEEVVCRG